MILSLLLAGMGTAATAQNINLPIIQTKYTADPAPYVHNDTVYLYTTHDEDGAEGFLMKDWLLYTSTDMVNWQDRGAVASLKDFKWFKGENGAWAEQVIERNGKWYMYCPIHGHGIGVLVADNPYGPFKDPLGKPLAWEGDWFDIDPTVWIDDDNQAYMYWGNPELKAVKLNEDMISYSDSIMHFPKIQDYQEGPWFWKRNGNYYLAYASTCCPEGIGYAMSKNPLGPWEYKGHIMNHTPRTRGNHPGIIDYKGAAFDLPKFVDPSTGFISTKSKNGRELKALELPGLWNGAMSDWNTVFVEVPLSTFNPVKTVNDLLREQHQ